MSITRNKRRVVVAAIVVAAVIAVGIGIAAWSIGGSGNGYAKATTASSLTLADATAFTTAQLYPGATGDLKLRLTNPNSFPVRVTAVSGNGTITSDKGAACDASTGVTFTDQSGLTLDVAASADGTFTLSGTVAMSNSSNTTCQGAVFTVPVTLTGASNA